MLNVANVAMNDKIRNVFVIEKRVELLIGIRHLWRILCYYFGYDIMQAFYNAKKLNQK